LLPIRVNNKLKLSAAQHLPVAFYCRRLTAEVVQGVPILTKTLSPLRAAKSRSREMTATYIAYPNNSNALA
jgi:hypothetical protein